MAITEDEFLRRCRAASIQDMGRNVRPLKGNIDNIHFESTSTQDPAKPVKDQPGLPAGFQPGKGCLTEILESVLKVGKQIIFGIQHTLLWRLSSFSFVS